MDKKYYTTAELARMLGISRIAVYKKIQSGEIKAQKMGRNFVIFRKDLPVVMGGGLTERAKRQIDKSVNGMVLKLLTITEVEYVAHSLAQELFEWDEHIPDFGTRFPNVLEGILVTPFQKFDKRLLYSGFVSKAS